MPEKTSEPRQNAPGQGRKKERQEPVRLHAVIEQATRDELRLLAGGPKDMAKHVRQALAEYLNKPEHRALIEQRRGGA